jgi:hypothetical protein
MMVDLSLVSMDEILAELDKRFDTVCLMTNKMMSAEVDDIHYHFKDKIGCLGLIRIADEGIKNDYREVIDEGFRDEN